MSSNAPAQLLGYSVQFPRALLHLLRGGPGDAVSVEILGDVATHKADATFISEEDKISTISNPLTNRSSDLWKTFYNWLQAIESNKIDLDRTKFLLYTNKGGREAIVNSFDKANSINDAKQAIAEAKKELADIDTDHEISKFVDYFMNYDLDKVAQLISKFELQIDEGIGFTEINYELERLLIGRNQITFVSQLLNGWLQEQIMNRIAVKELPLIAWDDYQKQFLIYFDRARKLELIDFALQDPPTEESIQLQVKIQPLYLRHLNHIEADEDEIVNAVSDYLRAKVNRDMWIENEMIDEEVAKDFETRLANFWMTQKKRIELTESARQEPERGRLLFLDCKIRQEAIRDMTPPAGTISGTYHAMVEGKSLGWHPRWDSI